MDDVRAGSAEGDISEFALACWLLLVIELDALFWIFVVRLVVGIFS